MAKKGSKTKKKKAAGRPTDFKQKYIQEVYKLCLLGLVDVEIAEFFEVSEKTLNTWKNKHKRFLQSMRKGKKIADMEGITKLYDRVTGYTYDEVHTTTEEFKDSKGEIIEAAERITKKVIKKHVVPDVTAGKFWFINRTRNNKEGFCERVDNTHSGPKGEPIQTITRIIVDPVKENEKD